MKNNRDRFENEDRDSLDFNNKEREAELLNALLEEFKNYNDGMTSEITSDSYTENSQGGEDGMPYYVKSLFSGSENRPSADNASNAENAAVDEIIQVVESILPVDVNTSGAPGDTPENTTDVDQPADADVNPIIESGGISITVGTDDDIVEETSEDYSADSYDRSVSDHYADIVDNSYMNSDSSDSGDDDGDDEFSTRELRFEFFTQEFDEKFREMMLADGSGVEPDAGKTANADYDSGSTIAEQSEEPIDEADKWVPPSRRGLMKNSMKKKKSIAGWIILMILCLGVFVYSGYQFATTYISQKNEARKLNHLAEIVSQPSGVTSDDAPDFVPNLENHVMNPKYKELSEMNPDFVGWLNIPDTNINYPVMHTPEDSEYYLHRDFDGEYSFSGMIFVDGNCDIETSDNQIIYGHNMKNGTMFGTLDDYSSESFWKDHQYIYYDSLYEEHVYQIVSICHARVLDVDEEGFRYYWYYGSSNQAEFNEYVDFFRSNQLYDTGVDVEYGDKLITLSTCAYFTDDARFVVVAKQVS